MYNIVNAYRPSFSFLEKQYDSLTQNNCKNDDDQNQNQDPEQFISTNILAANNHLKDEKFEKLTKIIEMAWSYDVKKRPSAGEIMRMIIEL